MKFVCSGVSNCCEDDNIWPVKGREEHAKVYPFTVSLPRYASWRVYVRILVKQLKSCNHCKAAANAFPISTLPEVHTLPSGKVLIFKGLKNFACDHKPDFSRSDDGAKDGNLEKRCSTSVMDSYNSHHHQSFSTFHEPCIEEYDMVSIDPNCPKHGRYSLTAWLQKEGAKVVQMKSRANRQIYLKAKISQNHHIRRIKQVQKIDGIGRSVSSNFWKPLDKLYKHILDKDVVEKTSKVEVSSPLKKRKSENLEFTVLKQIETNTTTNPSLSYRKQPNILSTYSHQKNSISEPKQTNNSKIQMAHMNRKIQFISKEIISESNDNKEMSVKMTPIKREKCEIPFEKDLIPISNKGLGKDASKCPKTYASQYQRICRLKGLNYRNCFESCNEAVERNSQKSQCGAVSKMTIESKLSFVPQKCVFEENDKLFNGTTIKLRGDDTQSTSTTLSEFTKEEQLIARAPFEMKELEQAEQQLEWVEHEDEKLVNETHINLVGDEPSTCTPTWFTTQEHQVAHDVIAIEEVEQTRQLKCVQHENESLVNGTRIKLDKSSKCAPTWFSIDEHQMSRDICNLKELGQSRQRLECVQCENDNLVDETTTCTLTRFTIEEQQMPSSIFDIKELEKTQQRLEKIVDTTKSLQLGLNDHLHCDDSPIEKVRLSKAQVLKRSEAQEWLSNIAIERATNKILETYNGGRVRQLVQAFESIR